MDNSGTTTTEKIVINGQEYSPEDATQYLELGRKYKDIESKLNTSLDKVYPEYTKASQRNKELEQQLKESDAKVAELSKPKPPELPEDKKAIRQSG